MSRVSLSEAIPGLEQSLPRIRPEDKVYIAENHIPFDILKVELLPNERYATSDNVEGLWWLFTILIGEPAGQAQLAMGYNDRVNESYQAIKGYTDDGKIIGPVELEIVTMKDGNSFHRFVEPQSVLQARLLGQTGQQTLPF